jgi:hypothetical protein
MSDEKELDPKKQAAGRMGGNALKKKTEGSDFYEYIGKMGGDETKRKYGDAYFKELGAKGGKNRWKNRKDKKGESDGKEA